MTDTAAKTILNFPSSRVPNFAGIAGSIASNPFVLHSDLTKPTGNSGADADQPYQVANGLLTEDAAGQISSIIPITCPAEFHMLQVWVAVIDAAADTINVGTEPKISLWGKHEVGQGKMPSDYVTGAPVINHYYVPLSPFDRSDVTRGDSSTNRVLSTGVFNGSSSYKMHAFNVELSLKAQPNDNTVTQQDILINQTIADDAGGTSKQMAFYPHHDFILEGASEVLCTVNTAGTLTAGENILLMGRFIG